MRAVVIGARRKRQGIGEFVARQLAAEGAEVRGIVGTSDASVDEARRRLEERYSIHASGHTSVEAAIEAERPDVVAICSPASRHLEHLEIAASAGVHCLCEKPFWWGDPPPGETRRERTERIVDRFERAGRHLSLITQWPCTVSQYFQLFPEAFEELVERFDMELSPGRPGPDMVLDAAPHLFSLLYGLLGSVGEVVSPRARFHDASERELSIAFEYRSEGVEIPVTLELHTCQEPPRPAAYGFNGHRAERKVHLPEYTMTLEGEGRSIELPDPLRRRVRDFLEDVEEGAPPNRDALVSGMVDLEALYSCVPESREGRRERGAPATTEGPEETERGHAPPGATEDDS